VHTVPARTEPEGSTVNTYARAKASAAAGAPAMLQASAPVTTVGEGTPATAKIRPHVEDMGTASPAGRVCVTKIGTALSTGVSVINTVLIVTPCAQQQTVVTDTVPATILELVNVIWVG